jgi:hypothetical protein
VTPLRIGVAAGIVLAGPPLYALYRAGNLSGTDAVLRGLIAVAICTVLATVLTDIYHRYEREARKREDGEVVKGDHGPRKPPPS